MHAESGFVIHRNGAAKPEGLPAPFKPPTYLQPCLRPARRSGHLLLALHSQLA